MEFKEFENPEQKDYDVKVGTKASTFTPPSNNNDALNTDEGIDLNALCNENVPEFTIPTNFNSNFEINEFGEIIRPEEKGKSR